MLKRSAAIFLCFLLAVPAGSVLADEFDVIVSDPPKPDPETEVPFFGEQVIVEEEKPEPKPKPERRVAEKPKPAKPKPVAEKPRPVAEKPKPGKPMPRPVAEKPKPEKPKPVAEAKPRRQSNRLEIPADAARRNDLSFLKGCWYFERKALRADAPGAPFLGMVQDRFCFNGSGRGTFTQRYVDSGREYSAPARASFSGGRLVLQYPMFRNMHGRRVAGTFTCDGQDAGTVCRTYAPGTRYLSHHGTVRISRRP